jgi:tRNA A37 threonylcarbamoyladenosine synthetase subunit TsaC/SUA5/YrdC
VDGGPTRLGRESTVVEITAGRVEIRREGALSRDAILAALKETR